MFKSFLLASILVIICQISGTGPANADNVISFDSGDSRVQLVELFTSEGCSSCPPAEQYISQLLDSHLLWQKYVPVAFHVDYWDYIGWKDKYADAAYSQRQRLYSANSNSRSVYTPQFLVDGAEWRGFFRPFGKKLPSSSEKLGRLKATINNDEFDVRYKTDTPQNMKRLSLNIAITGTGITTKIRRGENKGRTLTHDFVVLAHQIYQAEMNDNIKNCTFKLGDEVVRYLVSYCCMA